MILTERKKKMKLNKEIEINGIKIPVVVNITLIEENLDSSDLVDLMAIDRDRLESGDLFSAAIHVEASALGIEGFDSLGQCFMRHNNIFNSEPFDTDLAMYLSEYGLVENALDYLKVNIINQAQSLKKFA